MKSRAIVFLLMIVWAPVSLVAQSEENTELFIADMLTLADNFARPASNGATYQASAGWFSSAKSLEKWEFRISVHGNALFVPAEKKNFSLNNSQLRLLEIENAQSAQLPTAFGSTTDNYLMGEVTFMNPVTQEMQTQEVRFKAFEGIDRDYIPHAFLQLAVGLPYETELTVRAMPEVTIDDVTASTYGVGLKHSLSQYFIDDPDGFQLAAAIAFSRFNVEYGFEPIEVQDLVMMDLIMVDADLWMMEAIASQRWGVFEAFAAAGVANSNFNYEMGGDGIALSMVNTELQKLGDTEAKFKADLGFNLHFGRFRISAMGTGGKYFNANLGLHVRI